jgi:hypothetical protein
MHYPIVLEALKAEHAVAAATQAVKRAEAEFSDFWRLSITAFSDAELAEANQSDRVAGRAAGERLFAAYTARRAEALAKHHERMDWDLLPRQTVALERLAKANARLAEFPIPAEPEPNMKELEAAGRAHAAARAIKKLAELRV